MSILGKFPYGLLSGIIIVLLIFSSSFAFGTSLKDVSKNSPPEIKNEIDYLTLEETLGSIFITSGGLKYISRGDVKAKPYLKRLIKKANSSSINFPKAISLLGYLSKDEEDFLFIVNLLDKYSGTLTMDESTSLRTIMYALGLMARHGNESAKNLLVDMTTKEYWENQKYRAYHSYVIDEKYNYVDNIIATRIGYRISGMNDVEEVRDRIVSEIDDTKIKKIVMYNYDPQNFIKSKDYTEKVEKEKITYRERRILIDNFNHNIHILQRVNKEFKKIDLPIDPGDKFAESYEKYNSFLDEAEKSAFEKKMIFEAKEKYDEIKQLYIKRQFHSLFPFLLNQGVIRKEEFYISNWDKLLPVFERIRIMQNEISNYNLSPTNYKLKRTLKESYRNIDYKDTYTIGDLAKYEIITVSFEFSESAFIGLKDFQHLTGSNTIAPGGTLIVVMRKIDNKWYWNPFGWW